MDIELVTDPDACMMYIVSPLASLGGGILWRPPTYSLFTENKEETDAPFLGKIQCVGSVELGSHAQCYL